MLTSTFVHAPGIGVTTERSLWAQGATTWEAYRERRPQLRLPARKCDALDATVDESLAALAARRVGYFASALPVREHWRAASRFPRLGYLDIETDGGSEAGAITVIGLYDGFEMRTYLKGRNLTHFPNDCQEYDGFVTFFGGGFDLPFLKRRFPILSPVFAERLHIDLCPLLRKLGYTGGLKQIEQVLKIPRVPETEGLTGYDAVRLWDIHARGGRSSEDALRLLTAYNREDVVNMKLLLEFALPRLRLHAGDPELCSN